MRWPLLFLLSLTFLGCAETTISKEELRHLNGYWEISAVEFPDGGQKNYGLNPTIEFIQWDNEQGFRKKVQPKFDGTYNTSNNIHDVAILNVNQVVQATFCNIPMNLTTGKKPWYILIPYLFQCRTARAFYIHTNVFNLYPFPNNGQKTKFKFAPSGCLKRVYQGK